MKVRSNFRLLFGFTLITDRRPPLTVMRVGRDMATSHVPSLQAE
ncbi:hypothetical protein [Nonomuraea sp. CA-141351]